jgi:hypothetical protein
MALIHQKIFPQGNRLDRMVKVEPPVKVQTTTPVTVTIQRALFEVNSYLKRFFYLVDTQDKVVCRACAKTATGVQERSQHTGCYAISSDAMAIYRQRNACAICVEPVASWTEANLNFDGLPVCSKECMEVWEWMNPMDWDDVMIEVYKRRKLRMGGAN